MKSVVHNYDTVHTQYFFHDLSKSCSEDVFYNMHRSNHCLHDMLSFYVPRLKSLHSQGHDSKLSSCHPVGLLITYMNSHCLVLSIFCIYVTNHILLNCYILAVLFYVRLSYILY